MGILDLYYRGDLWSYAFANVDSRIGFDGTLDLVKESINMYLDNIDKKDVEGINYEGRITNTNKYFQLGAFGGICFKAELDVDSDVGEKKANLSFLVMEYINHKLN